jgi:peptide/nickel transport system substrate-binding protein
VIVNFIRSDPTLLLQATSGKADVTVGLTKQAAASLRDKPCCRVVANTYGTMITLTLPNRHPPFDNRTFREALSYAVPYDGIVREVQYGYAKTFYGPFPPAFTNYNAELGGPRTFDIQKAKQLIEQSGATLPVNMDLLIREGETDWAASATIIKDTWRQLGVNVRIKTLAAGPYLTARNKPGRTYSLILSNTLAFGEPYWVADYDLRCGSQFNFNEYCNPAVDKLVDQAFYAPRDQKQALWDEVTETWVRDAPSIQLYSPQHVVVLKAGTQNYFFSAAPLVLWKWSR